MIEREREGSLLSYKVGGGEDVVIDYLRVA